MTRTAAPSPRGLLLSEYVTSLTRPDAPIPGPALPEIALAGRSNVGKSTLLNLLVGRRSLARASRTPGKTRALNVFSWGDRCYLVDVPGYGWAKRGQAERAAWHELALGYVATRPGLAGVLWLLDIRRDPSPEDLDFRACLVARAVPTLVVLTKSDQVGRSKRAERAEAIGAGTGMDGREFLLTSARTREGAEELREAVLALLG